MTARRPVGLGWCLGLGLGYAAILSLIASLTVGPGGAHRGLTLPTIIGIYVLGGVVGGSFFWVLQVIRGSTWGRALIGFVCVLPMMSMGLLLAEVDASVERRIIAAVVSAAVVGGGIGLWVKDL